MANWNLRCQDCGEVENHVVCSIYAIPTCPKCGGERALATFVQEYSPSGVFPFTVNHVNGKPMVIESLAHLRKVESNYGVVFSAFSKDNHRDLDPIKDLPKFKG